QGLIPGSRALGRKRPSRYGLWWAHWHIFESRRAALETAGPFAGSPQMFWAGAYRDALPLTERLAEEALERGELALAAMEVGVCSGLRAALGDLAAAERDLVRAANLAKRAGNPPHVVIQRGAALFEVAYSRGMGLELGAAIVEAALARDDPATRCYRAPTHALA